MNNYTEQQIKDRLAQLATIQPAEETVRQANQKIQAMLISEKQTYPLVYSIFSAAAMLLICLSLFYIQPPLIEQNGYVYEDTAALTRIQLNLTFSAGGEKALDEHFEKALSKRDARPKTITLQNILQEL